MISVVKQSQFFTFPGLSTLLVSLLRTLSRVSILLNEIRFFSKSHWLFLLLFGWVSAQQCLVGVVCFEIFTQSISCCSTMLFPKLSGVHSFIKVPNGPLGQRFGKVRRYHGSWGQLDTWTWEQATFWKSKLLNTTRQCLYFKHSRKVKCMGACIQEEASLALSCGVKSPYKTFLEIFEFIFFCVN